MEKRLDKIEEKLDKLLEQQYSQNVTLAKNTESLILHEKRTDLAEQRLQKVEDEFKQDYVSLENKIEDIQNSLKPIIKHVTSVNAVLKFGLPIVSFIGAAIKFFYERFTK